MAAVLVMAALLMALAVNPTLLENGIGERAGLRAQVPRPTSPELSAPQTRRLKTWARPGTPVRLEIPALGIEAPIVPIGLQDAAILVPPEDPSVLGWWRSGAAPGARTGTALLTGHTVHSGGGALDDLEQLESGDHIVVWSSAAHLDFRVQRVSVLSKEQLANEAEQLFSQSVPGRLVLVTCEDWNGTEYESNVVVTGRLG